MNNTRLNSRQAQILKYLVDVKESSRKEISNDLFGDKVSRITIIRDLNYLLEHKYIEKLGGSKYVKYKINPEKILVVPFDIDKYFEKSLDIRKLKHKKYNFEISEKLKNLFSDEELELFERGKRRLNKKLNELDSSIVKREFERFIIELSWKSSQIEGNTYSLLETEDLIKNKREAPGHTKDEATMILNHKTTFDEILTNKNKYQRVSLWDIRSIHSELVKGLKISKNFREHAVGITGTKYAPLDNKMQIQNAMEKLANLLKTSENDIERAFILLIMISYIQPFTDGNKRTSRMVSNAILISNGYYPLSYRSVDEVKYKKALILFYEQNNLFHLKKIFIEQQKFAIENYFK